MRRSSISLCQCFLFFTLSLTIAFWFFPRCSIPSFGCLRLTSRSRAPHSFCFEFCAPDIDNTKPNQKNNTLLRNSLTNISSPTNDIIFFCRRMTYYGQLWYHTIRTMPRFFHAQFIPSFRSRALGLECIEIGLSHSGS